MIVKKQYFELFGWWKVEKKKGKRMDQNLQRPDKGVKIPKDMVPPGLSQDLAVGERCRLQRVQHALIV